MIFNPRQIFMG